MPAHLALDDSRTDGTGTPSGHGEHRLTVSVRIASATAAAVRAALGAALAAAPGPPAPASVRTAVRDTADGAELTLSCPATATGTAVADAAAVGRLFADTARLLAPPDARDGGGTLRWERAPAGEPPGPERPGASPDAARGDLLRLADVIPGTGSGPYVRHLDRRLPAALGARLDRLADETGRTPDDVAHLALTVVLQRLGVAPETLGTLRPGRTDRTGTDRTGARGAQEAVPARPVDPDQDARTALALPSTGPAATGAPPFDLVLDRRGTPPLPQGWELLDFWCPAGDGITLALRRTGTGPVLRAESAAPAGQDRLRALLDLWEGLLADLLARPGAPLSALALLPAGQEERQAAVLARAQARAAAAPAAPLAARFREHVRTRPDAPACRQGIRTWSYRRLGRRAAAVAARLAGLGDGAVVAVLADAEPDLLAALLAVSSRGATFLPLSPQEPAARLRDALVRSGASLLLTGTGAPAVPAPGGCPVLALRDIEDAGPDGEELPAPPAGVCAAPAYLLRTSGSTGVPKLVAVGRPSLDNYLDWAARTLLTGGSPVPVVSSPIFDASLKQTLGPLYAGGCVQLLTAHRLDLEAVRAELSHMAAPVTLNCVPSYFSALLSDEEDAGDGPTMRLDRLLLGGEPLSADLLRRIRDRYPAVEVWNFYGPTETTSTATAGPMLPAGGIHVGTPVAGAAVAVVDRHGAVLPEGVVGEVVIAGPGVALGYLGEGSGPSPFTTVRPAGRTVRVYRTGDLGRLDGDGNLRVAGRRDSQIKLNGWRIDLQEVEQVARRAPGVREAVVVLDDRTGTPCLRAFVTGRDAEPAAVRRALGELLPRPMVPASVTVLPRFDTTATGKVDRAALLARATGPA
ncbi:AMP-binding protein [Streptomyces andamanensis]|uniref:AMP-binding protein n=1 Tax=Streptomyces andamanensis TaxID=1565035 RepID=A0ABV8TIX8_9ACTN